MSTQPPAERRREDGSMSLYELLMKLDLATEVLEGLDELGLDTRAEVEALLSRLERQIADAH